MDSMLSCLNLPPSQLKVTSNFQSERYDSDGLTEDLALTGHVETSAETERLAGIGSEVRRHSVVA